VSEVEIERLLARHEPAVPAQAQAIPSNELIADLSARNRLHGFIEEVRIDGLLAQIRLRVGDQRLTAVITADAVHALHFKRGDDALAIIKSTEVMIARATVAPLRPAKHKASRKPVPSRARSSR
jgi:molybdopterin-binding protein